MEINDENYKIYLPRQYVNNNYIYSMTDNHITINTRNNCYQQYNVTYCDCFNVYPSMNYISTSTYSCNVNLGNTIYHGDIDSNILNIPNISNVFIVWFIILFIPMYIITKMFGVFRKRSRL